MQGETVEIFRLKTKTAKKTFFEISEFIKVLNPYTALRAYEVAQVTLNTGDAYRRNRKMYAKNEISTLTLIRRIEDPTPDDTYLQKDNDRGRIDFVNDIYKQTRRLATIRFGGNILLDSNLNSVRQFNAEQQLTADNDKGAITIIDDFENQIFVAQEAKCHTRLVGKTTVYLGDGGVAQYRTDDFLAKQPYYLDGNNGCKNSESYIRTDSSGMFFDAEEGVICKYSAQNGIINVSGYDDRYKKL